MKLLVCLFLIVVLLEEYNCAPYTRTRSRYRHHHGLQYGSSRHSPRYVSPGLYSRHGYGYQPRHYTYHPWRDSRRCTWHGSRYSSRHCSGFGSRHSSRAFTEYYPRYGTRHFIPNAPNIYNTEDKLVTEVTPIYMLVEKTTARPEKKSTEELVAQSTEKPLGIPQDKPAENLVEEPLEKSTVQPTLAVNVIAANPVKVPEDNPQIMTEPQIMKVTDKPVEKSMVKPTLTVNVAEAKVQNSDMLTPLYSEIKKTTEEPVIKSTVKPILVVTTTNPVSVPENKPQDIKIKKVTDKPVEESMVEPALDVIASNTAKKPEDEPQDETDEKLIELMPVENTLENRQENLFNKPSPNSVKSSSENLSDYSTVSPFDDWPVENQSELSTENPFSVINIFN